MDRLIELAKRWPYLTHFRVVAEFESLSKASRRIGVSVAALSKSIRLLEKLVDVELFDRTGGGFRLNDRGHALLLATRGAMRDLDETIANLDNDEARQLRVGIDGAWVSLVLAPHPKGPAIELVDLPSSPARALLRGDVDVVIHVAPVMHREVETVELALLPRAVCVAPEHPLAEASKHELGDLAGHAIVLPKHAAAAPGCPAALVRLATLTSSTYSHAIAAVRTGQIASVLPNRLAEQFGLRCLRIEDLAIAPLTLLASIRKTRGTTGAMAARWRDQALLCLTSGTGVRTRDSRTGSAGSSKRE